MFSTEGKKKEQHLTSVHIAFFFFFERESFTKSNHWNGKSQSGLPGELPGSIRGLECALTMVVCVCVCVFVWLFMCVKNMIGFELFL